MIRVLVAEADPIVLSEVAQAIIRQPDTMLSGTARCEEAAERLLRRFTPRVVVCDSHLPGAEPLALLKTINRFSPSRRPQTILLTELPADGLIRRAFALGASTCLIKPVCAAFVARKASELGRAQERSRPLVYMPAGEPPARPSASRGSPEHYLTALLLSMGMPAHLDGYRYLKRAVLLAMNSPSPVASETLYQQVAAFFNTSPSRVERSIRHAIQLMWQRSAPVPLTLPVGATPALTERPTNRELIALLTEALRLQFDTDDFSLHAQR